MHGIDISHRRDRTKADAAIEPMVRPTMDLGGVHLRAPLGMGVIAGTLEPRSPPRQKLRSFWPPLAPARRASADHEGQ